MTSVSLSNVEKYYGSYHALSDINLTIESGQFVVIVGPSGCGKSTLLRSIAGLEQISSGTIVNGERDITFAEPHERGVAMVFQNYALYPHMSISDNMGFGLKIAGEEKTTIRGRVEAAARMLGIGDYLEKLPKALSGGQKQRVAIGRAITRRPDVFLFDEPLSNLDAALRTRMRVELNHLHQELGATMIYVTHDQVEAMTLADSIVVMRDGIIEQVGSPNSLYFDPVNRFVAGFLGAPKMNILEARVESVTDGQLVCNIEGLGRITRMLDVPDGIGLEPGDELAVGFRPEVVGKGDLCFRVIPAIIENLGREVMVYGSSETFKTIESDGNDGDFVLRLASGETAAPGLTIEAKVASQSAYIFDSTGATRCFARVAQMQGAA